MDKEKIGSFIKQKRNELGYSQKELAELLHVTPQAISKWENGRGIPDIEIMKDISKIFNVALDELTNGEEIKKQKTKKPKYYLGILVIIIIMGVLLLSVQKNETKSNFEFLGVSSHNESFELKGVAAYSKEQKSLYISSIEYQDECHDLYTGYEFDIYEIDNDHEILISKLGNVDELISEGEHLPLLLKNVELKIDNFETNCSDISEALEIMIKAKRTDGAIVTFIIPLEIGESCAISVN